jgi:lysophospholipase L1-like esterase
VNNDQIAFTAVYDFAPGNYKVARYTLTAPGVQPSGINYLAMGDSFASGEGAFAYTAETDTSNNRCHLSTKSYGFLLTNQLFQSGRAVACSGAKTEDVINTSNDYRSQLSDKIIKGNRTEDTLLQVKTNFIPGYLAQSEFVDLHKPDAVTLSIGGNDIGFAGLLASCVSPVSIPKACYPTYEDRQELFKQINGIFDELVTTYTKVKKPGKRVYAIGYPHIVVNNGSGSCASNVHFETSEIEMTIDLIEYLNQTVKQAAAKAGVKYVDVSSAFFGRRLCEAAPSTIAVNGLTAGTDQGIGPLKFIGNESYHPNAIGHELLANAIRGATNNLTAPMPGSSEALTSPALPADQHNLPKTGRTIASRVADNSISPNLIVRGTALTIANDPGMSTLKPGSAYKITVGPERTQISSGTASPLGAASTGATMPVSVPAGFQPLIISGVNMLGQPVDIVKTVYVAATETDYDGDGTPNTVQDCGFISPSGSDIDRDGVDDSCDAVIGNPPPLKLTSLTSKAYLTGNSLTIELLR